MANNSALSEPTVGNRVVSLDGQRVGKVKDVLPGDFLVVCEQGSHTWLSREAIFTVDQAAVTLICDFSGVRKYETAGLN